MGLRHPVDGCTQGPIHIDECTQGPIHIVGCTEGPTHIDGSTQGPTHMQTYPQKIKQKKTYKSTFAERNVCMWKKNHKSISVTNTHKRVSGKRLTNVHLRRETCVREKRPRIETDQKTNARHF